MTRAQSMDVVNDSTTLQSRIDTVLSAPIMEWDHSPEIQWQPGDPLWPHPKQRWHEMHSYDSPVLMRPHGNYGSLEFYGGNHVRYMFEIVGLYDELIGHDAEGNEIWEVGFAPDDTFDAAHEIDCEDCLVGIGMDEVDCWVCGKKVRDYSRGFEMELTNAAMQESRRLSAENRARRYRDNMTVIHEGIEYAWTSIDWAHNYFEAHPDREIVRIMRYELNSISAFQDFDPGPSSMANNINTLSRRDVANLRRRMWEDMADAGFNYDIDTNTWRTPPTPQGIPRRPRPQRMEGVRSRLSVTDETLFVNRATLNWSDGIGIPMELLTPTQQDVELRAELDMQVLWGDGCGGTAEPPTTIPTFEELRQRGMFDADILQELTNFRQMITWAPDSYMFDIEVMGASPSLLIDSPIMPSRLWDDEASLPVTDNPIISMMYDIDASAPELNIPRISVATIRPDLYRSGYERFFEGDTNAEGITASANLLQHSRGNRGRRG